MPIPHGGGGGQSLGQPQTWQQDREPLRQPQPQTHQPLHGSYQAPGPGGAGSRPVRKRVLGYGKRRGNSRASGPLRSNDEILAMMLNSGENSSSGLAAGLASSAVGGYEGGCGQPPVPTPAEGYGDSIPRHSDLVPGSGLNQRAAAPSAGMFRKPPALPPTERPPPRRSGYANFAALAEEDAAVNGTDRFPDAFPECQPPAGTGSRARAEVPVPKRPIGSHPYRASYVAPKAAATAAAAAIGGTGSSGLSAAKPFTAQLSSVSARAIRAGLSFPDADPQGTRPRREARIEPSFKTELHYKEALKDCIHEHLKVQLSSISNILQLVSHATICASLCASVQVPSAAYYVQGYL